MKLRCPACNVVFQLAAAAGTPGGSASGKGAGSGIGKAGGGAATPADANAGAAAAIQPAAGANPPPEAAPSKWSGAEPLSPVGSSNSGGSAVSRTPSPPTVSRSTQGIGLSAGFGRPPTDWHARAQQWTQPLVAIGLLLVLGARGCDGLAAKNTARLQSRVDLEQRYFDEEREQALLDVQKQIDQPNVTPTRKTELQKQHDQVQQDYDKRRRDLQAGAWREMTNAAGRAAAENRVGSYWREMWFVVGTLLFSLGLLMTALLGVGADRWLAFGLLAIVIFSVYIGGTAWMSSLAGVLGR